MGMLGDTLEEIASEKAGIIKNGCPVVTVRQAPEAARVIEERARECKAPVYVADQEQAEVLKTALTEEGFLTEFRLDGTVYQSGLAGLNQIENGVLAILASEVLGAKEYAAAGLKRADWPGRFQLLRKEPYLIIDGAHNEGAALALRDNVKAYLGDRRVILVMGIFADKEYEKIVKIMADCGKELITFTTSTARALPARKLTETAEKAGYQVTERKTAQEAVKTAFQRAGKEDVILAFGSLSFLGDVIRWAGEGSLAP